MISDRGWSAAGFPWPANTGNPRSRFRQRGKRHHIRLAMKVVFCESRVPPAGCASNKEEVPRPFQPAPSKAEALSCLAVFAQHFIQGIRQYVRPLLVIGCPTVLFPLQ